MAWADSHMLSVHSNLDVELLPNDLFAQAPQVFGTLGVIGMGLEWLLDDIAVAQESSGLRYRISARGNES